MRFSLFAILSGLAALAVVSALSIGDLKRSDILNAQVGDLEVKVDVAVDTLVSLNSRLTIEMHSPM